MDQKITDYFTGIITHAQAIFEQVEYSTDATPERAILRLEAKYGLHPAFYDLESHLPYFDHVSRILGAHKRRILLQWIREAPAQGPILEVGSGIGTFARQLGCRGYQVLAVDISPVEVSIPEQVV